MAVRGTISHRWWVPLALSLALALGGLAGVKHGVVDVLMAASRNACPHLRPNPGRIILSCVMFFSGILGVSTSIGGRPGSPRGGARRWDHLLRDPVTGRMTQRGWLLSAVIVGTSFLVYAWVKAQLFITGDV